MKTYPSCADGHSQLAASGRFCLSCGQPLDPRPPAATSVHAVLPATDDAASELGDTTDPNYWTYLMHDAEIIDADAPEPPSGPISFYAKSTPRRLSS